MSSFFKKYFTPILLVAGFFGFFFVKFSHANRPIENTLTVGLQSGYPPFEFVNEQGQIVGFDIDLAALIAEKLGKKLVVKDMEFEGEILSLKQGRIDLIVSGMNITPARLKEIHMIPYRGEAVKTLSLIFWNEIPAGVDSLEDIASLTNSTVSVESGTVPETYMQKFKDISTKSFQGALGPLMDVKYGKSAANLVETDVAEYLQKRHPEIKILPVPLAEEETILGFGIGVKKENRELFEEIQNIIEELKASGALSTLEKKWFEGGK